MKICIECGDKIPEEIRDNLCELCREEVDHIFKPNKFKMIALALISFFKILFIIIFNPITMALGSFILIYLYFGWELLIPIVILFWATLGLVYIHVKKQSK